MSEFWFSCAWTPGEQSLNSAPVLHHLALPLHPMFSDTTRVQPRGKVAHGRKEFHYRRLRHPRDNSTEIRFIAHLTASVLRLAPRSGTI